VARWGFVAPLRLSCTADRVPNVSSDRTDPASSGAIDDAEAAMSEARARLAEAPADVVVANHAMGLYELAAIHLSASPPRLADSALAIDAFACLVEGLGERLGSESETLRTALSNIRMAFVQIKASA
jgi:hypothetical protein